VGGSPEGEVADELVLHMRWQCPLPERLLGCVGLLGFVGDALGQMLDPTGEPVEVVTVLSVLP
jgi:hypothetical protein